VSCAKIAEPIEMPFGLSTRVGLRKRIRWGAHWRHLENTTEASIFRGDAAFSSNYLLIFETCVVISTSADVLIILIGISLV